MINTPKCNWKQNHWSSVLALIGVIGGLALVSNDGLIPVANAQDELVYVPLDSPCRVVNTRNTVDTNLIALTSRDFFSFGSAVTIDAQGGNPAGCDHPRSSEGMQPTAIAANITAVGKQGTGNGNITAYPAGTTAPGASTVNYTTAANIANSTLITLRPSDGSFTLLSKGSDVPAIVDVVGYFYPVAGSELLVDCDSDAQALKNLTLTSNMTYILNGICEGQIRVGEGLGTITIKGDGIGVDDGITLPSGETDGNTVFAAIYAIDGVKLNLSDLEINVASYNGEADLYIAGIGAYWGAIVTLNSVDIVGGDQGIGIYNSGMMRIGADVTVTGFREGGIVAGKTSTIRVFDPVTVTGGSGQAGDSSEAIAAVDGSVVDISGGGTLTPASGTFISVALDSAAAISAFRNGVIRVRGGATTVNGSVWSGESSTVDLRNVTQSGGNIDAYRNSVLRVRSGSSVAGASADRIFSGAFSTIRMDDTTIGNASGTGEINLYRYGIIDLRGTTNMNNRDVTCSDPRGVSIEGSVTNQGDISCIP